MLCSLVSFSLFLKKFNALILLIFLFFLRVPAIGLVIILFFLLSITVSGEKLTMEKLKDGLTSHEKEKNKSINLQQLYIFGAGHIGQELSSRSIDLDFKINLVDSRIDFLNLQQKDSVNTILANSPWLLIKNLPKNSFFIILTHSHDYDFKIINEILRTQNFKFLGLIGSKTKFNRFKNRLLKIGHKENLISKIECPVGLKNISSKKPAEIAISIIGRLLEYRSQIENYKNHDKDILKKINE